MVNRCWFLGSRLTLIGLVLTPVAWAAAATPVEAGGPAAETSAQADATRGQEALRASIDERYEVVRLSRGIGLVPKVPLAQVRLIELAAGTVAINGAPVSGQELREQLGVDADLILQLTYLDEQTRLVLFGLDRPIGAPEPAEVAEPPAPPEPPAVPEPPRSRSRARRSGGIVRVLGNATVDVDEIIRGDIVVIGGTLRVDGSVTGDITVIAGTTYFGPEAEARGDVTVVGGTLRRAPGSLIEGQLNDVSLSTLNFDFAGFRGWPVIRISPAYPFLRLGDLMATLLRLLFLGMIASVVLFVAREPVERIAQRSADEPLKAGVVGLAAQLLFCPLLVISVVILAVSIIGIPLLVLVPVALIAALLVLLAGFTGVARGIGQWIGARLGRDPQGVYLATWMGVAVILTPTLLGRLVDLAPGFLGFFAITLVLTGFLVEYAAWTTGLGAAILNRFGSRPLPQPGNVPPPAQAPPPPVPASPAPDLQAGPADEPPPPPLQP